MIKDTCLFPLIAAQSLLPQSHKDSRTDGHLIINKLKQTI
jgi:hypothetical protein